jgi:hypothetical protein
MWFTKCSWPNLSILPFHVRRGDERSIIFDLGFPRNAQRLAGEERALGVVDRRTG